MVRSSGAAKQDAVSCYGLPFTGASINQPSAFIKPAAYVCNKNKQQGFATTRRYVCYTFSKNQ